MNNLNRASQVSWQGENRSTARSAGRVVLLAAWVGAVLALGGCASGQYNYTTTIGTGERLVFPLVNGSPEKAKKGSIQVVTASLLPNPDPRVKEHFFGFAFTESDGVAPKSVVVEDVTEKDFLMMVEDHQPELVNNSMWRKTSRPLTGEDRELAWLGQLGDTLRVYRFTITKANGEKVVLNQAWIVPGLVKPAMRREFGLPPL